MAADERKAGDLRTRLDAARSAAQVGTWIIAVAASTVDAGEPMFEMYALAPAESRIPVATFIGRIRVLEAGFPMHLAKPVDPNELIAAVVALSKVSARA